MHYFRVARRSGGISAIVSVRLPRSRLRENVVKVGLENVKTVTSGLPVIRPEWQIRGDFLTQATARAGPRDNRHVELLYQCRTQRERSVL